jgi:hypothetical protein
LNLNNGVRILHSQPSTLFIKLTLPTDTVEYWPNPIGVKNFFEIPFEILYDLVVRVDGLVY